MTLRADLERDGLAQRALPLDRVVAALRARACTYGAAVVPPRLSGSLSDFQHELKWTRQALDALRRAARRGRR